MKSPQEIIESGMLELYAMGAANAEERQEVEAALADSPYLRQELNAIEISLEAYAKSLAVSASQKAKNKFMAAIASQPASNIKSISSQSLPDNIVPGKIYRINRWLAAASVALLVTTAYFGVRYTTTEVRVQQLETRLMEANTRFAEADIRLTEYQLQLAQAVAPNAKRIALLSTKPEEPRTVMLFIKPDENKALLAVDKLPDINVNQDFQLWAIVDGKPIDMGVINQTKSQFVSIVPEWYNAQAFAITIEQKGGSPQPTLEQMVVVGNNI